MYTLCVEDATMLRKERKEKNIGKIGHNGVWLAYCRVVCIVVHVVYCSICCIMFYTFRLLLHSSVYVG